MLLSLLLDTGPTLWTYTTPFLASLLSFVVGYIVVRLNRSYTENKESEAGKNQWRDSVVAANKATNEALAAERSERLFWQLGNAADLASITEILKASNDAQKLLAEIATTTRHHAADITRLQTHLDSVSKQLNDFILGHVKRS